MYFLGWFLFHVQVNGVLCTQALLYAVGLGKGAIPTAAAVNWVLKVATPCTMLSFNTLI
jgi:hypothetical protein